MTAVDILIMLAGLLGGLTFFLFGMNAMSEGLENMAGGALEKTLKKVTKNQFLGIALGAGITIAIQSSSAMTVMLVGLVNSGIINFSDTFGMIMGSNIGTTLTAWLLSLTGIDGNNFFLTLLQPMIFAPILAFAGIIMRMVSKNEKKRHIGMILIGFSILMAGMDMMSEAVKVVRDMDGFTHLLTAFSSPVIALLISMVFTGIIQSSAATIGIVQALALTGSITYQMAIPLVLGANIGTCITALISSFGTNKNAKRVVAMHIYVNVIGSVLCMIALYVIKAFSADSLLLPISMFGVAIVHTLFNTVNTVLLMPVRKLVIRLCEITVPDKGEKTENVFLDERIFHNSSLAIGECCKLTCEMAELSKKSLLNSIELINNFDEEKAKFVKDTEKLTDKYEDKLSTYLVRISSNELTDADSHQVGRLLHSVGDFERIADHALNICDVATEIHSKNIVFSDDAIKEINIATDAVVEILNMTVSSFVNEDIELASHVEPLEQVIDNLRSALKTRHVNRLRNGECTIQLGFVYTDLLSNYERIADHCSNIAVYTLQMSSNKLDAHKYLKNISKGPDSTFANDYKIYEEKYSI